MVNVLLSQGKYATGLEWAKKNYEKKKLNAFHIQAYFICMLRKSAWSPSEKIIIDELMDNIQKSHDYKAKEIFQVMKGEYEYYIKDNFQQAVYLLNQAKEQCEFKNYPVKALIEIYRRRGMKEKENSMFKFVNIEEGEIPDE